MNYKAQVKAIKEVESGTILKVFVPNSFLKYDIERLKQGGRVTTEMRFNDPRRITNEQRAKFFATVKDIAESEGEPEHLIEFMFKYWYCTQNDKEWISLSDCSVSVARELINMQIDYILEHDIQLSSHIKDRVENVDRYLYKCLLLRKCCITGEQRKGLVHIHHCTGSKVGMGNNRRKIRNKGRKLIALRWDLHEEVERNGDKGLFEKNKVYGICIDDIGLKKLRLSEGDLT